MMESQDFMQDVTCFKKVVIFLNILTHQITCTWKFWSKFSSHPFPCCHIHTSTLEKIYPTCLLSSFSLTTQCSEPRSTDFFEQFRGWRRACRRTPLMKSSAPALSSVWRNQSPPGRLFWIHRAKFPVNNNILFRWKTFLKIL